MGRKRSWNAAKKSCRILSWPGRIPRCWVKGGAPEREKNWVRVRREREGGGRKGRRDGGRKKSGEKERERESPAQGHMCRESMWEKKRINTCRISGWQEY